MKSFVNVQVWSFTWYYDNKTEREHYNIKEISFNDFVVEYRAFLMFLVTF